MCASSRLEHIVPKFVPINLFLHSHKFYQFFLNYSPIIPHTITKLKLNEKSLMTETIIDGIILQYYTSFDTILKGLTVTINEEWFEK